MDNSLSRHSNRTNVSVNALGMVAPLIVALYAFPVLLAQMGAERFGWLILIWTLVGYFNLFDLGISRAITRLVAIEIPKKISERDLSFIWSGVIFLLTLGVVAGSILLVGKHLYLSKIMTEDQSLLKEVGSAAVIIALTLPFVLLSSGSVGVMEAYGRFKILSMLRACLGIITFVAPIPVYGHFGGLDSVAWSLLVVRLTFTAIYFYIGLLPIIRLTPFCVSVKHLKKFLGFGAWITVSNVIGPLMLYGDRFLVAMFATVAAAGYYGSMNEMLSKLLIIPSAILGVYFPIFCQHFGNMRNALQHLKKAITLNLIWLSPVLLVILFTGPSFAEFWMGIDFANALNSVLPFILLGIVFNSIGLLTQSFVQAANRPDLTAKLHLIELVAYGPYAVWLISEYSIVGASVAWAIRTFISCICLAILVRYVLSGESTS